MNEIVETRFAEIGSVRGKEWCGIRAFEANVFATDSVTDTEEEMESSIVDFCFDY